MADRVRAVDWPDSLPERGETQVGAGGQSTKATIGCDDRSR